MYSVDQTKYIIDNILDNVVGKNNHKFVSRMAGKAVQSKIIDIVDNKCVQNNGNEVQKDVN